MTKMPMPGRDAGGRTNKNVRRGSTPARGPARERPYVRNVNHGLTRREYVMCVRAARWIRNQNRPGAAKGAEPPSHIEAAVRTLNHLSMMGVVDRHTGRLIERRETES